VQLQLQFTLAEAVTLIDPPMTETQLRNIIRALGWKPHAWRQPPGRGHPTALYNAADLMQLHAALVPFLRPAVL
jgi:hypothetical protein